MSYICFDVDAELKKATQGKKTKVDVGVLLFTALEDYPEIQAGVAREFGITVCRD